MAPLSVVAGCPSVRYPRPTSRSVEIMELLVELNDEKKITVIMVTHEPDMAEFARRRVTFRDGGVTSDERMRPMPSEALA